MTVINTRRLELRAATREALLADLRNAAALAACLDVSVPENWPPELYDEPAIRWSLDALTAGPETVSQLLLYYFIRREDAAATLIGLGGFRGMPRDGRVEIGYSMLDQFQRQGYATEAVRGLLEFVFARSDVSEVIAETMPASFGSIGVLKKNGFHLVGAGTGPGVIRFAITRAQFLP